MKKVILYVFTISFTLLSSCTDNDKDNEYLKTEQSTNLTELEIEDLKFLREEEKLARDVYLFSYDLYKLQIFKNISNSEQQHMNSVLKLLNNYNLEDPASTIIGEFNNTELQSIYNSLIEKSKKSLLDALEVGNIIEDLDINDIALNEKRTSKVDILNVYSSLKCGSRNHLRNFNNQLLNNGGVYLPSYISENTFNSIINSDNEKCGSN